MEELGGAEVVCLLQFVYIKRNTTLSVSKIRLTECFLYIFYLCLHAFWNVSSVCVLSTKYNVLNSNAELIFRRTVRADGCDVAYIKHLNRKEGVITTFTML